MGGAVRVLASSQRHAEEDDLVERTTHALLLQPGPHGNRPPAEVFTDDAEVPNSEDHNFEYDFSKWERVPFREKYANQLGITFEKPLLIISNKYNTEWSKGPVNFLDLDALITNVPDGGYSRITRSATTDRAPR